VTPLALYLHFPYCWSRCHYCAFNTVRWDPQQSERFLRTLLSEIERYGERLSDRSVTTVYLGGGTPSIFAADAIAAVLETVRARFRVAPDAEVTLEANPGTVRGDKFATLRRAGVTRLSMGVQSFHDAELTYLGRAHTSAVAEQAYAQARAAGFSNVNLDFIYALPGQSLERWRATLERATALRPEHLSAYALTIEPGTRFGAAEARGDLVVPDEAAQTRFFAFTRAFLAAAGYPAYEISNYARPGCACRHNLVYWSQQDYLGLGPGAFSYLDGHRFCKRHAIEAYIAEIEAGTDAIEEIEAISGATAFIEGLVFGLRKTEGADLERLTAQTGVQLPPGLQRALDWLVTTGLMRRRPAGIALTEAGAAVADGVAAELLVAFGAERAHGAVKHAEVVNFTR
jgi:oxygen-independent coproporphyrinogen-3 oxidase